MWPGNGYKLLFPPEAIPQLASLRGRWWQDLVKAVLDLEETDVSFLAFSLMMIRLANCLDCRQENQRALRGCKRCAVDTIRHYRGSDDELIGLFEQAEVDVDAWLQQL